MLRHPCTLCAGVVVAIACGRTPAPPSSAEPETGLVGAGKLAGSDVLLGIVDDPPRVWRRGATGVSTWRAPAQIGALAVGARPSEVVVAAAWSEARLPRAEVWWLADGAVQRHCAWQAPQLERWKSQPRGASSVVPFAGGAIVAGVDGSLVQFDAGCAATVLHTDECCDGEAPLHLRASATGWSAYARRGTRVYPADSPGVSGCTPMIDASDKRAALRAGSWTQPLPAELTDTSILDWSDGCDAVLIASATHAWTCRATGCARVR